MSSPFYSMCSRMIAGGKKGSEYREQREKERHSQTASAEGWFCFRNWNVSRLDFYFQFTFQIQLPKLFDLSPCLLTRKRTLGLLSWELGAHVERLARIHIPAKFSHTKGPARGKKKDESGSRQDFKGRAAAPGPAQAPPSADIRRNWRASARARPRPEGGWRGPAAQGGGVRGGDAAPAPPAACPRPVLSPGKAPGKSFQQGGERMSSPAHWAGCTAARRCIPAPTTLPLGVPLPDTTPAPPCGSSGPAGASRRGAEQGGRVAGL